MSHNDMLTNLAFRLHCRSHLPCRYSLERYVLSFLWPTIHTLYILKYPHFPGTITTDWFWLCIRSQFHIPHMSCMRTFDENNCAISELRAQCPRTQQVWWDHWEKSRRASTLELPGKVPLNGTGTFPEWDFPWQSTYGTAVWTRGNRQGAPQHIQNYVSWEGASVWICLTVLVGFCVMNTL